jgi:hypothetical protein
MAWVYLDDKFPRHPKILGAMQLAQHAPWLFICGLAYCREHLTGGLMSPLVIPTLTPLYKPAMRDALVTVGLWEGLGDGWIQVHDYEDWNSSEDTQREARSAKARRAADARWNRKREEATAAST